MVRSHSFAWILSSLLSLTLAAPLQADITATGDLDPAGSGWWASGGDSLTNAYIGKTGTGSVSINSGYTDDLISKYGYIGYESSSTGSVVTVDGIGSTWTNSVDLSVGHWGDGTLNITDGGVVSNNVGNIGFGSMSNHDATGVVTVDGIGSTWTNSDSLYVGFYGDGTLNITDGGVVSNNAGSIACCPGSTGKVTVNGSGSTWTNSAGLDVHGTLDIENGGNVSSSNLGYIGVESGQASKVTVDGSGSTWTHSGRLYVGFDRNGMLEITNGGSVINNTSDGSYISYCYSLASEVMVDGIGSAWTNSGDLYVGYEGNGTLNITNGGVVSNTNGYIEDNSGSISVVTVDGIGSTWTNSGGLYVSNPLNIINGGIVEVGGALDVLYAATLNINGGSVTTGSFSKDPWAMFNWTSGTLGFNDGLTINSATPFDAADGDTITANRILEVANALTIGGSGTLELAGGSVTTGSFDNTAGGTFNWTSGTLGFNDGLTINSATPFDAVGGDTITANRILEVANNLTIGGSGTLDIDATGKVTVGGSLVLAQGSTLTADVGATIHMTGSDFQNESTNSANLAGLGNLKMIFEGGSGVVDPFEAAGEDVGAVAGGFVTANFLLDTLQLGGVDAGKIQLVDDYDNQSDGSGVGEAVYVFNLVMNAGATIDLNGLELYYLNGGGPKQFFCGDATLDGFVDQGDLSIILGGWGQSVPPANPRADLDGDLFVDQADLSKVLCDWGKGVPSGDGGPAPEPTTMLLLALGGLATLKRRRL